MRHFTEKRDIRTQKGFTLYRTYDNAHDLTKSFNFPPDARADIFWGEIGASEYLRKDASDVVGRCAKTFSKVHGLLVVTGFGTAGSPYVFGVIDPRQGKEHHYFYLYRSKKEETSVQLYDTFGLVMR